jgi:hypothetical protein
VAPSEYSLKAVKQEPFVRAIGDQQLAADIAQRRFEPRQAAEILEHAVKLIKHMPDAQPAGHEIKILERLTTSIDSRAVALLEAV